MPTLFRFLTVVLILAGLAGAVVYALANLVEPNTREMTIRVPASKLEPKP
jgi:phage shock protein PspC (stress-responsive transcriptional regulator)